MHTQLRNLIIIPNLQLLIKTFTTTATQTSFLNPPAVIRPQHRRPLSKTTMSRPEIYITRNIKEDAVKLLREKCNVSMWPGSDPVPRAELAQQITGKDALFCTLSDKIDKSLLEKADKLKVIATMSVGFDHIDTAELKKRQIRLGYTPDVLADATAELTLALLLATSRRLIEATIEAKTGGWQAWSPDWLCGPGLKNATVGVAGMGRIGQQVAQRVKAFNCKRILYYNRSKRPEAEAMGAVKVDFDDFLRECDFIIVCLALTPETQMLFNAEAFEKMKKTAVFVNTSRGALVDQDALVKALKEGRIRAAGLDVTTPEPLPLDHDLFKLRNCVVLPHIGSAAIETRDEMAVLTARNILAGLEGKKMPAELII